MTHPRHRLLAITLAASLGIWSAVILLGLPSERGAVLLSNLGQCLAPMLAAGACVLASRRAITERQALGWKLLAGSAGCWALGQVVWTYYEVSGAAAPFPSFADVGYLLAVPLALAAIWTLTIRNSASSWFVAVLDGLILAGGLLAISWALVLGAAWEEGGDSPFLFALTLAYPVGDLVVVSAVLLAIMRTDRNRDAVPLVVIAVGLVVLGVADSIFVWTTMQGTEQAVSIADIGWTAGYLVLVYAASVYPLPVASGRAELHAAPSLRRAALPLTVVCVAWVIRMVLVATGQPEDEFLTLLTITTVALVLLRFLMTMRENQALTSSLEEKIGELTAREQQLSHQALHDPLTGLANRRLFSDRVEHALNRSRRTGDLSAVLFIDLDDFKTVNDSLGHGRGDDLLVAVGRRIADALQPSDTAARFGGDEFAVLVERVDEARALATANRILDLLAVPLLVGEYPISISASIGVAHPQSSGPDPFDLLRNADLAMYEAKREGKGTARAYRPELHEQELRQFAYRSEVGAAIERDQLHLVYQPIIDLATEQVTGAEALVRWTHPEHGQVSPLDFIPVAEATRAIIPIGRWVLRTACAQLAEWVAELGPLTMDVNVSAVQLLDPGFAADVAAILEETGVDPGLVVLELTESLLVQDADDARSVLEDLREIGVRLAIDDFGTGYSSLAYLQNFPIDIVKIDRAFVNQLGEEGRGRSLARSIIAIAGSLGIDTIAEGIETPDQAADLSALACAHGQGYHYSRPIGAEAFTAVVADLSGQPA